MVRSAYYDKNGVKRGAWSKDEDQKLRAYIERYGHSNWRQLPKFAGLSRCGKSCRLRWVNYLRPNIKHGNFTHQEEQIIIKLHQQHGNKWSLIAGKLPGRTDNEVKNHWHSHLKKRLECNHDHDHDQMTYSEFKLMKQLSDTNSEGETAQYTDTESEKIILGSEDPSYNIFKSSQPMYSQECCDVNMAAWEIFEEFSNFWSQPFIQENNPYSHQNYYPSPNYYATNGVDTDQYLSYLFDNRDFLCQVMQEFPN